MAPQKYLSTGDSQLRRLDSRDKDKRVFFYKLSAKESRDLWWIQQGEKIVRYLKPLHVEINLNGGSVLIHKVTGRLYDGGNHMLLNAVATQKTESLLLERLVESNPGISEDAANFVLREIRTGTGERAQVAA